MSKRLKNQINAQVISLYHQLKGKEAITSLIPAYCSLTVCFNRNKTSFESLSSQIEVLQKTPLIEPGLNTSRIIEIPVCYEPAYASDMEEVEEKTNLSQQEIIALHCQITYKVYMLGFVAGFAYLGSLPQQLYCPRKAEPRKEVLAGSVGLAGLQTGIYPVNAPGGWQIIGRTPIPTFNPKAEQPTLLKAGDKVKFKAISISEFEAISAGISTGKFNLEEYYG